MEGTAPFLVLARRPLLIGEIIKSVGLVYLNTTTKSTHSIFFFCFVIETPKFIVESWKQEYLSGYLNAMGSLRRLGVPLLGNSMPPIFTLWVGVLHSKFSFAGLFGTLDRSMEPFLGTKILCFASVFSSGVGVLHSKFIFAGLFGTLDPSMDPFSGTKILRFPLFSHLGLEFYTQILIFPTYCRVLGLG